LLGPRSTSHRGNGDQGRTLGRCAHAGGKLPARPRASLPGSARGRARPPTSFLLDQGIAPHKIAIGGDSAGGAGSRSPPSTRLRDAGKPLPGLPPGWLSPWVDLEMTGASLAEKADVDPLIPEALSRGSWRPPISPGADPKGARWSRRCTPILRASLPCWCRSDQPKRCSTMPCASPGRAGAADVAGQPSRSGRT